MRQTGRVISSDSDKALIQVVRQSACGGNCKSCGGSCNAMGVLISAPNSINAKQGELVQIDSDTNKVLKIAVIFYIVPLIVIVAGIIFSKLYFFTGNSGVFSDAVALIIASGLYALSLFTIHLFTKRKSIDYTISRKR